VVEILNPDNPYVPKKFNITVSNPDAAVEVNSLPEKNKPENFYGLTGIFSITAAAVKNKIPVGENGHLVITINGTGNFDAINKPDIIWPANTEHFEGNDSQRVSQANFPITGYRVFDIPFIGKAEGNVMIPPVKFCFFNTSTKTYETISSDSVSVTFTKALTAKDKLTNIVNYDITNRKYLWIVPCIAATVALIGLISYKRNKKQTAKMPAVNITPAPVFAQPLPAFKTKYRTDFARYLDELKIITDNKRFFAKAKSLLTKAVAERIDSNQYSEHVLLNELIQRTYNAPVCNKVADLYEAINLNLYAPFETEADLGSYFSELKLTIEMLQEEA
jgi:hypothetical protein